MSAVDTQSLTSGVLSMPVCPLSLSEREEIRAGIVRGETNIAIGVRLGRHRCTIGAEIARNGGRSSYRAFRAHDAASLRRRRPKQPLLQRHPALAAHVQARLEAKDSPMTIAVELVQGVYPDVPVTVSHETIYQAVYDPCARGLPRGLHRCLHRPRRLRHRQGSRRYKHWRDDLPSIWLRPSIADDRVEVGHLEGDLIIGTMASRSAIATVFDRASRHLWMAGLPNGRNAEQTLEAMTGLLNRIPPTVRRTLTWDQGQEMVLHKTLTERCGIDVYFADPHSPWQRPTNENGNGLIRRYVGKRTDLSIYTSRDLQAIETRINTMPRRIFGWSNAKAVYDQNVAMTT